MPVYAPHTVADHEELVSNYSGFNEIQRHRRVVHTPIDVLRDIAFNQAWNALDLGVITLTEYCQFVMSQYMVFGYAY